VEDTLNSSGKPVSTGSGKCSEDLNSWYVDGPNSARHVGEITLFDNGSGGYVNRWGETGEQWSYTADVASALVGNPTYAECRAEGCVPCPWNATEGCDGTLIELDGTPFFFPVDGIEGALDGGGYEAKVGPAYGPYNGWPTEREVLGGGPLLHNFHFTTEVTYWFPFASDTDATLEFTGDDDVWVFVNGKLAVDLGNTHAPENGSVTLTASTVRVEYDVERGTVTPFTVPASAFGLSPGNIYEIKVFHAERKRDGSSFRLTLDGFNTTRSECVPTCGDGIIGYGEECDDGGNNGGYNACQSDCTLGAYCGDGIVQENEACDDADPNAPGNCSGCSLVTVR
jgi:fibro-slime domain-containing protein